jgi:hypothetical protein
MEMVERKPFVLSAVRVRRLARKSAPLARLILAIQRMEDLVAFSIWAVDRSLDLLKFPRRLLVTRWQSLFDFFEFRARLIEFFGSVDLTKTLNWTRFPVENLS